MNRISSSSKEYFSGGGRDDGNYNNTSTSSSSSSIIERERERERVGGLHQQQQHRRGGLSLVVGRRRGGGVTSSSSYSTWKSLDADENLDLFSRNRPTLDITSSSHQEYSDVAAAVSMKLGRLSVGSVKLTRSAMDDLLFSSSSGAEVVDAAGDAGGGDAGGGKHDYDWLLTPPGSPHVSSSNTSEPQSAAGGPRNNTSLARSVSTTKASRLSVTQPENSYSSRPTRSSSVTRPSIPMTNYTSYSSNRSSLFLNTSSTSVTAISRQSTPSSRSSLPSTARPSTPTARHSTPAARAPRTSTPVKSRPTTTISSGDKTRTPQNSRPSTPTSRSQIPANMNSLAARSNSRPSTPTRRNTAPPSQVRGRSASVGRTLTSGQNAVVASRGSSPGPRARTTQQPVVPPDYSLDTPPNLRTTLPNRPISTGRSRPIAPTTVKGNSELPKPVNPPRRQLSSPVITRGRLPEPSTRGRLHANGHNANAADNQKTSPISEAAVRRPSKPATATESTGFGRTISKKSLDMALRHMDIRNGSGSNRTMSGTSLFPQSVRPGMQKGHRARLSDPPHSVSSSSNNGRTPAHSNTPTISDNGSCIDRSEDGETEEVDSRLSRKVIETDIIYEGSRYDTILFKEDLKNTNWLSIDEKSDMGLIFDQPFEPLPEPFDPL